MDVLAFFALPRDAGKRVTASSGSSLGCILRFLHRRVSDALVLGRIVRCDSARIDAEANGLNWPNSVVNREVRGVVVEVHRR